MMYLIFRHDPIGLIHTAEGFMAQGSAQGEDGNGDYLVYNSGGVTVKINSGYGPRGYIDGSGLVVNGRIGYTSRDLFLEVATHEHGHYLFGDGHITYSKMAFGAGREFSLSPWESIKLGYIIPKDVNYSTPACTLGDISSRYGSAGEEGNIIEVAVDDYENDIFLIANRQKVSDWDRRMAGDTIPHEKGYLKNINSEYGKGLYIYHINGGFYYSNSNERRMDMECADGLWNWQQFGYSSPDWDQNEIHPAFRRATVSYVQDDPDIIETAYNRDGLSLCMTGLKPDLTTKTMGTWYSIGKPHQYSPKVNGTDKLFTNETGTWYSLETAGDRWDAWKPGDKNNEIFSPYSSPNTNTWENDYSGLFIYLSGMTGTDADINIYRVGHGGYNDEMQILEITPPSKPMGIRHDYYYPENSWCVPQIIWNHNMEPDMEQVSGEETFKRYLVYRATAPDMSTIPNENNYVMIEQVDIPVGVTPHYEDLSVLEYDCAELDQRPPYGIEYPVRYRVRAVDKFEDYSVLSDFVSTTGINQDGGIEDGGDNPRINSNMPKEFNLSQNYPNPFNPVTKINFAIPKSGFVTLKIYDILGREIKTLVNEVKQPGYYTVDFNGSSLASGVYFYRIVAGNFINVKRMILIK
jgi:hypothetical protein